MTTSAGPRSWPAPTATAASRVNHPRKTVRRVSTARSAGPTRSTLHAIEAWRVWCRASGEWVARVSQRRASSTPLATQSRGKVRVWAAASSKARGRPSRPSQMATTWATSASLTTRPGRPSRARSRKRRALSATSTSPCSAAGPAAASDGTRQTSSPARPKGSRDVTSTCTSGQPVTRTSTSSATGPTRCSALSTTRRAGPSPPSRSARAPTTSLPDHGASPTAKASSSARLASSTWLNSTHHAPPGWLAVDRAASSRASRVLPHPPAPVSVTSRWVHSRGRRRPAPRAGRRRS